MYLSKIKIKNFRGIKELEVTFNDKINIIIGENGSCKSALIDAIRILYNFGNQKKDIYVENKDFYKDPISGVSETLIEINYEFRGISNQQKGAFYELLVIDNVEDYLKISLNYEHREGKSPTYDYSTGATLGQKADYKTFELFQHYYLDALRDSTKDLLNNKNNILGNLVMRLVRKQNTKQNYEDIITNANSELLKQDEVTTARDSINKNIERIFRNSIDGKIGLRIDDIKAESFINTIKPFLPFSKIDLTENGLELTQNSLGYNNLVYIATVLGDITNRVDDEKNTHFALLIEEPEAHLHPQLQLNLFNFIRENVKENTQIFITSHSPTLTSKINLENLILLDHISVKLNECFDNRLSTEKIIEDVKNSKIVDYGNRKKQLERYIDVTKSQLFFAKSVLFVEGISEELLIPAFCRIKGFEIEDYRIELVNVGGTSFYPFLYLFNSSNNKIRIEKKVAILTDDDRFSSSKDSQFSFKSIIKVPHKKLDELYDKITKSKPNNRLSNLNSVANNISSILIKSSFKTLEFEIAKSNILDKKSELENNFFVNFIKNNENEKFEKVKKYYDTFDEDLTPEQQFKIALLFWKILTDKADFAQDFSIFIVENLTKAKTDFNIPQYINEVLNHVKI